MIVTCATARELTVLFSDGSGELGRRVDLDCGPAPSRGSICISGTVEELRTLAERILDVIPQPKEETRDETVLMPTVPHVHGEPVSNLQDVSR
jgi:hypothetical protein